jgi:hypothetical protein
MNTSFFSPDQDPMWDALARLGITILVLFIVIRFIFLRYSKKKGSAFSFFMMGIMIHLICVLLKTVEIQLGIALGLFAIFAIMRFRSEGISLRSMTYFFTVIGISVINAMANFLNPIRGPILINSIIIISLLVLELLFHSSLSKLRLTYDKVELLDPDRKRDLLSDLSARTGRKIEKVSIRKMDLGKGNAELTAYYRKKGAKTPK